MLSALDVQLLNVSTCFDYPNVDVPTCDCPEVEIPKQLRNLDVPNMDSATNSKPLTNSERGVLSNNKTAFSNWRVRRQNTNKYFRGQSFALTGGIVQCLAVFVCVLDPGLYLHRRVWTSS